MRRYECLQALAARLQDELVVTNIANTATEWLSLRPHPGNLYAVGMGMVTAQGLGLALALPDRRVLAIDGDGGILFDLSILGTLAQIAPANLCVIVFDNGGYASIGTAPATDSLSAGPVDLQAVARAAGLTHLSAVATLEAFAAAVDDPWPQASGPRVIIARTDKSQAFVGTSPLDAKENKYLFVRHVEATTGKVILRPSAKEHRAKPKPDPASRPVREGDHFAPVVHEALKENDVDFVVGLPCSGLAAAQALCHDDPSIRYVGVAHEGTGIGVCAGAWLGGKRPAALFENFGLFAAAYHLLRGNLTFGIPLLLVLEYRGDGGDQEFWSETGELTEAILAAMRIRHRVVTDMGALKPAIRDGVRWMQFALRPYAVVPALDLTRQRA